ncbi:glycosyltransferase [Ramlibacter alkalitolerans]|uniref:Glycosyltransferase family 2 protein n=1 Tax=Ramlibacter alkalitolerans TaxID=2039631 RepID=A0ABS1JSI1_9BURK|nr:glycosyltransferase family 2 protein [Ramlibacter alkalitolerans]MBL0426811.1 glycosyltransferase family 2 protein [Ramlibacter alkalitolerans]
MIARAAELTLVLLWVRMVLTCMLGAWACRRRRTGPPRDAPDPGEPASFATARVSIVVPAFDEAQAIEATLRALQGLVPAPLEIIVVDDGSGDATCAIAQRCLDCDGQGRVIRLAANAGKAAALRIGIAAARGDFVLTVDADTCLAPDSLAAALATLQHRHADAVAFCLEAAPANGMPAKLQRQEYAASLDFERAAQDAVAAISVLPGAACLFRREVLLRHPFSARTRTEDADLTLTLARHGACIVRAPEAVARTLVPASWSGLVAQRTRWITGHVQCCARQAARLPQATWRFRLLVFPNFVLSTFLAPAGALSLLALWAGGGGRLLPLDAWGATAVSTLLVYLQRGVGLRCAPRRFRPLVRHFVLEPAVSGLVGTVCFACAVRDLLLDALRGSLGRARGTAWRAGK